MDAIDPAITYYRNHAPAKAVARVGLQSWHPIIAEMIEDYLSIAEMEAWMSEHHAALGFALPTQYTLRKWVTEVRKNIGKPLRVRNQESTTPKIETPPVAGDDAPHIGESESTKESPIARPKSGTSYTPESPEPVLSTKTPERAAAEEERTPNEVLAALPRNPDGSIRLDATTKTPVNLDQYRR